MNIETVNELIASCRVQPSSQSKSGSILSVVTQRRLQAVLVSVRLRAG